MKTVKPNSKNAANNPLTGNLRITILLLGLLLGSQLQAKTEETDLHSRLHNNLKLVEIQRRGLSATLAYMASEPTLFPPEKVSENRLVSRDERQQIRSTWVSFLDRMLILDSVSQSYSDYAKHDDESLQKRAFRVAYAAFLARYRYTLDFLRITERDPAFHVVLNEAIPELGLPQDTYANVKYQYLHLGIAAQFTRLSLTNRLYGKEPGLRLNPGIEEDERIIWRYGNRGEGIKQTLKNGAQIIKDTTFKAFFPIQKGVSEWMGDVRVRRKHRSLISKPQIDALQPRLQPGDVLLERREWYLSNIGLPGYWPHAALYIGSRQEREDYFQTAEIAAWVKQQGVADSRFETLLRQRHPEIYAQSLTDPEPGHSARIIEAVGEGVLFTSLEHSAAADSLAVLRPRLTRLDKAKALLQAFRYVGRPYDFDFDFLTDSQLVCTELVFKAYEPARDKAGLSLPVTKILGRLTTPANLIAKQFDQEYETPSRQFDLVLFLDGQERTGTAREADLASFRQSWKRPKWHIITQGSVFDREARAVDRKHEASAMK